MYCFLLPFLIATCWAQGLSNLSINTTIAQVTTTASSTSSTSSTEKNSTVPSTSSTSSSEKNSTVPSTSSTSSSEKNSTVPSTSVNTTIAQVATTTSSLSEKNSTVPSTYSTSSSEKNSTVLSPSSFTSSHITTSGAQPYSGTSTSASTAKIEQSTTSASATTISTASPSIQTSNSSDAPASTTPGISKVTSTKMPSSEHTIKISETNLLIDSVDIFLELEGPKNTRIENISLVIQNATVSYSERNAILTPLEAIFNDDGFFVSNLSSIHKQITDWTSVLIVLLNSSKSELDSLVYSTDSKSPIDNGVNESYFQESLITFNPKDLPELKVSFSRCSPTGSSKAFVVTKPSRNKKNTCQLNFTQKLELKMTSPTDCVKDTLPQDFKDILTRNLILEVNKKKSCGFSWNMINDLQEKSQECHSDKSLEVTVSFSISSAFQKQLAQIVEGYKSFLTDKNLTMNDRVWSLDKCFENCSPSIKPPTNNDDDKIRLTVAVVVSCIGVFLIVLIAVVVYMKNKRHRILQFRMTRLDDDEDDLIGDMDDFVGNQGPTFRTFR